VRRRAVADRLVNRFLDYIVVEKGLSPNTHASYRRDLERYAAFLDERGVTVKGASSADVSAFLVRLDTEGLSVRSYTRALMAVRGLYRYLMKSGVMETSPCANVDVPKIKARLPDFLTLSEVDALLEAPDAAKATGLRDKAMIEVLYATGLRVSELVGLDMGDVSMDLQVLRVISRISFNF